MQDGALMGARFDDKQKDGRLNVGNHADGIGNPALSAQNDAGLLTAMGIEDETTVANELQTHLKVRGEYFSLGTLLETGQAARVGDNQSTFVSTALGTLLDLRQKAAATLDVFPDAADASSLESALTSLWNKAGAAVDDIFGDDEVSLGNFRNDDRILDQFDRIINALSDVSAFQAATSSGGVFADADLSADAAATAFAAEQKEAMATFGALGNTRFGTFWRKIRADATSKLADPAAQDLGAFAYGTTGTLATQRTRYVRQGTGSALYLGRTEAIDGKGSVFSGDIEIQVRFAAEKVNAVIKNLVGESGAWEYLYANVDVEEIILPDTSLGNAASWNSGASKTGAMVSYATRAGIPRPVSTTYTFRGQLLGRDAGNQGNEAVGVWSLGSSDAGRDYLAGGFGAMRGDDLPDIRPEPDSGAGAQTKVLPYGDILGEPDDSGSIDPGEDPFHGTDDADTRGQTIAGGMLSVIGRQYDTEGAFIPDDATTTDENEAKYRTHEIDLEAAVAAGATAWANGPKHVDLAKGVIEKQLRILEADIGLAATVKTAAWVKVQDAILAHLFGFKDRAGADVNTGDATVEPTPEQKATARAALPGQLGLAYNDGRNGDFVNAVVEVLDALQNNNALKAALDVKGIFYREKLADFDPETAGNQAQAVLANKNGKGPGNVNLFDRRASRVQYLVGSTDFTRFGAWRRQTSSNANDGYANRTESGEGDGPNALAYSSLAKTSYLGPTDPRYPLDARMTYEGEAVAVVRSDFFQGSVDIEVLWGQVDDDGVAETANVIDATLNMSISDIENVANGARMYFDPAASTNTGENIAPLEEVVSIAINGIDVTKTLALSGTDGTNNASVTVMSQQAGQVATRSTELIANLNTAGDIRGNFVGQGVGGPLAVLGTWRMSNSDGTAAIGAKVESTSGAVDYVGVTGMANDGTFTAVTIHGGFGAELP